MISVGLIGYGYWGPNLLRNLMASPDFDVVAVADGDDARRAAAERLCPSAALLASGEDVIARDDVGAVVIATPVATHYALAKSALGAGKHVLVEKPMCATVEEGQALIDLAAQKGVTLMVDHTFLFTGAVQMLRELCRSGEIGRVSYYDSMRINLGLFQPDVNVMWDLAPHDLSIMDYLLDEEPVDIEVSGYCHVNPGVPDIVYLTLHFPSDMVAHFNLSWMSPVKVRRTALGGSEKMVVWDDLNPEEKIKIYNSGVEFRPEEERRQIMPDYRIGDVLSPRVSPREALHGVVGHFAGVIEGRETSIMDGERGLRVVRILERAQHILDRRLPEIAALRHKVAP
ncbi:MAG: Gfo/Idh/MocA family oxidoreductase [Rhodospirillales bacterium]|nr:Gfo/Idh/MocA family oxidoreductase [Rhodospirillales bacterium]